MAITDRIFKRETKDRQARFYVDLRDVGGKRRALIPPGRNRATTDYELAKELAKAALEEQLEKERRRSKHGVARIARLEEYAAEHLRKKGREGYTSEYLSSVERHLEVAAQHFGEERELTSIRPRHVRAWIDELRQTSNGRGGTFSDGTVRHYVNSLSNLFRRAVEEELVLRNPVAMLNGLPTPEPSKPTWLEPHEMALYLEAARTFEPRTDDGAIPFIYPLVATFALTGGRKAEVLGLRTEDVSFERRTVRIRPNEYRRLKTRGSDREVPLWSQLREILKRHLFARDEAAELLFPSPQTGKMIRDIRKQLDAIAMRAGMEAGSVRTRTFRHSYTSARLETLDHGQPVSVYRVAKELGHSSTAMIEKTYGHVGRVRHRSEEVEFRVEDFEDRLGDRLEKLREAS